MQHHILKFSKLVVSLSNHHQILKSLLLLFLVSCFLPLSSFSQGQWVWMKGDNLFGSANYGTKGIPGISNKPGGRYEPAEWTDLNGNFWLFGGRGFDDVGATV